MINIKVEKECGCFKNSDFEKNTACENLDEALEKANNMCIVMNEDFCHKHKFTSHYDEDNNEVLIKVQMNG